MAKNYTDFVEAMTEARRDGSSIERLVLTDESMSVFISDGNFTESVEEKHDDLGEFSVSIERGDGNYVLTERGERIPL